MTDREASNPQRRRWAWDQPVPLRWVLADDIMESTDTAFAVCADIDGLIADEPPPAPVERYTLLGCAAEGRLRAAVDGTGQVWLDHLVLDAMHHPDRPRILNCGWEVGGCSECKEVLVDLTVVGWRPSNLDATLLDIDLRGRPCEPRDPSRDLATPPPNVMGYRLTCDDEEPLGECREVAGLFWPRPQPPMHPVTLRGCRPEPPLRAAIDALRRGAGSRRIRAGIYSVTVDGFEWVQLSLLDGSVVAARASTLGEGLLDVTFDTAVPTMTLAQQQIWERWRGGPPTQRNQWAGYGRELRDLWGGAAGAYGANRFQPRPEKPAGMTYHLDGRHVTDIDGFYCAIGEAVNGPGGYFGSNIGGLIDSLRGGEGAQKPFRLVWHDSEVARTHLVAGYDRHRWRPAVTFDDLLEVLIEQGIEVDLR